MLPPIIDPKTPIEPLTLHEEEQGAPRDRRLSRYLLRSGAGSNGGGDLWQRVERKPIRLRPLYRNGRRRVIRASDNLTPALIPDHAHDKRCTSRLDEESDWSSEMLECIRDHAHKRMQITYWQLVAYWGEGMTVSLARTSDQSGSARCPYSSCEAAHSALLPNLEDNWVEVLSTRAADEGLTPELIRKLYVLGVERETLERVMDGKDKVLTVNNIYADLPVDERTHLLALGTHLYHVANSTVELPYVVNRCDSVIESRFRDRAIELVNEVSQNGTHPYEALQTLAQELDHYFEDALDEIDDKIESYESLAEVEADLCRLERNVGGYSRSKKAQFVEEYLRGIRSMRHLFGHVNKLNQFTPVTKVRKVLDHRRSYLKLSEKYAKDKAKAVHRMPREELTEEIKRIIEWTVDLHPNGHPLQAALSSGSLRTMRSRTRTYLAGCDSITLLMHDKAAINSTFEDLRHMIHLSDKHNPHALDETVDYLHNIMAVLEEQQVGTELPSLEALTGLTDESLEEQKLTTWAKCYEVSVG